MTSFLKRKQKPEKESEKQIQNEERKWDDHKTKNKTEESSISNMIIKGKLTEEEKFKILSGVCLYLKENHMKIEDFREKIIEKSEKQTKLWTKLASLSTINRTVKSIRDYIIRTVDNRNMKGSWTTSDEEKLRELVSIHGKKWSLIGKILERTEENVKDKYKEIGGDNYDIRQKTKISLSEAMKIIKYISQYTGLELFKYKYKFINDVEGNGVEVRTDKEESILYIHKDLKSSISEVIIYNTISKTINIDSLLELFNNKQHHISFTFISDKVQSKSYTDCKNFYNNMILHYKIKSFSVLSKKIKGLKYILQEEIEDFNEIDVKSGVDYEFLVKTIEEMRLKYDSFGLKGFNELVLYSLSMLISEEKLYIDKICNNDKVDMKDKDNVTLKKKNEGNHMKFRSFEEFYDKFYIKTK